MVGVNSHIHRFGAVAIFATLFAAIHVNGQEGCVFNFEDASDFELECNNIKNFWSINDDHKNSPKKVFILSPANDGCVKTKYPIRLNSTSVSVKFYREDAGEVNKFRMRLVPKVGSCPDEECLWDIANDPQYKKDEWVTAKYKFPIKATREYFVQIEVGKSEGKTLLESLSLPSVESQNCPSEASLNQNLAASFIGAAGNDTTDTTVKPKSDSTSLGEFSKNLLLTSASLLTLNNLLN